LRRWQLGKRSLLRSYRTVVGFSGLRGLTDKTAKRDGDAWIIKRQKKWIGNSTWCDISIIWARDVDDNQVQSFIVRNKDHARIHRRENPKQDRSQGCAERLDHNGQLPHTPREPSASGQIISHTAHVLKNERRYPRCMGSNRMRDGRLTKCAQYCQEACSLEIPIASFQLCKTFSAKMPRQITASQCMVSSHCSTPSEGKLKTLRSIAKRFRRPNARDGPRGQTGAVWAAMVSPPTITWGASFAGFGSALILTKATYQKQNLIIGKAITGLAPLCNAG